MIGRIKQYLFDLKISEQFTREFLIKREEIIRTQSRFAEYKGFLTGKKIVIVATGPSLNDYIPIPDAIHIGINKAYKRTDIKYDYFFLQDYVAVKDYIMELKNVDGLKFVGKYILSNYMDAQIPESIVNELEAVPYYVSYPIVSFAEDLSCTPFSGAGTTVISALQFAVFAGASEIYLVGCDTSKSGYFDNKKNPNMNPKVLIKDYCAFKGFVDHCKINTKIISVNPVGLKGIFEDIYLGR